MNQADASILDPPKKRFPLPLLVLGVGLLCLIGFVFADWFSVYPEDANATYVGGKTCAECHQNQTQLWHGSHHDKAMDLATHETVLGDFDDVSFEHCGVRSRMYQNGNRFMVHTEGPNGEMSDFQVKYVFGTEPIQQYMVEFDRPENMPENEIARLQVLRISWDTLKKKWFYIPPPDVDEKLAHDDPLHWTKAGQNWNHMCANCHSTNLQKNFDIKSKTYHTTFIDIDVNCESCHGPGSIHVDLAKSRSLFWDRKLGYGLRKIKGQSHEVEVETCAPCHSRRRVIHPDSGLSTEYYNYCANELLRDETYYADGQIKDEVYVYGSFIQSKMYHKGIKCSDCHNPHSLRLKHEGNKLCTSCHQHPAAKYDSLGHHHHAVGSKGASCIECHMPETPFMEIDLRRDHSLRNPRPDLSVKHDTPNACTGCHLKTKNVAPEKRKDLKYYADWLEKRKDDAEIDAEIKRIDQWASDWVNIWFPNTQSEHFANVLAPAWKGEPNVDALKQLAKSRTQPAIARASALLELMQTPNANASSVAVSALTDKDPQVRAAAIGVLDNQPAPQRTETLVKHVQPLLEDPTRMVRFEAARILASVPFQHFDKPTQSRLMDILDEYREGLLADSDQAGAHMSLALLDESIAAVATHQNDQLAWLRLAEKHYRNAIRVQPDVTGPRSNLAALLERLQKNPDEVVRLRAESLQLLQRDAKLAPEEPVVQYRYALALHLNGKKKEALQFLGKAANLDPNVAQFHFAYALSLKDFDRLQEAVEAIRKAVQLEPENVQFRYTLALYLRDAKQYAEAEQIANQLLVLEPGNRELQQFVMTLKVLNRNGE